MKGVETVNDVIPNDIRVEVEGMFSECLNTCKAFYMHCLRSLHLYTIVLIIPLKLLHLCKS